MKTKLYWVGALGAALRGEGKKEAEGFLLRLLEFSRGVHRFANAGRLNSALKTLDSFFKWRMRREQKTEFRRARA